MSIKNSNDTIGNRTRNFAVKDRRISTKWTPRPFIDKHVLLFYNEVLHISVFDYGMEGRNMCHFP
jgi:hypothetical protein